MAAPGCVCLLLVALGCWLHLAGPWSFWLLLAAPGCYWLLMAARGCSWLHLAARRCPWLVLVIHDRSGLLPAHGCLGCSWLIVAARGQSWLFLGAFACSSPLLAVPGYCWRVLAASGCSQMLGSSCYDYYIATEIMQHVVRPGMTNCFFFCASATLILRGAVLIVAAFSHSCAHGAADAGNSRRIQAAIAMAHGVPIFFIHRVLRDRQHRC